MGHRFKGFQWISMNFHLALPLLGRRMPAGRSGPPPRGPCSTWATRAARSEICWAACIGQDPALACWMPRPSPTHRISMLTQIHEPPVCLGGNMGQPIPSLENHQFLQMKPPNQPVTNDSVERDFSKHPASVIFSDTRPSQWRASLNRKRRRSTELQRIWLFFRISKWRSFFYVKCIFVLNHLICISKFLWRFLVDIVNWSCRWWSHELLQLVDPRSDKAQALLVTYRTASARICRALMSFSRGQRTKRGIPSWWPMSVSTKFRGLEMDAPSDIPYRY